MRRFSPLTSSLIYVSSRNTLTRAAGPRTRHQLTATRPTTPRPMSFLGSLFGSSSSKPSNMTYPDQRTDDEWRAVLNKGRRAATQRDRPFVSVHVLTSNPQSNSASSGRRALRRPALARSTSTIPRRASTPAQDARLLCTRPTTSSSPDAAGRRTLTACPALSRVTRTRRWG
jgi:hypothetical protein